MKLHGIVIGFALAGALFNPARAEDEVLDAALLEPSAATLPALPVIPSGQAAPVSIDLQGNAADGAPYSGQATLTPLPDGRVRVEQSIPTRRGRSQLHTGVGTVQGNQIRADLQPVPAQGGITEVFDGPENLQAQPLPVVISVDPQSGAVQSQSPLVQARGADKSHKVRDFFRNMAGKTKTFFSNAGQKTKGFFARIGSFFKNLFAKIKARFSRKKVEEQPVVAPTPITDAPGLGASRCRNQGLGLERNQGGASQLEPVSLPSLEEELPLSTQQAARG